MVIGWRAKEKAWLFRVKRQPSSESEIKATASEGSVPHTREQAETVGSGYQGKGHGVTSFPQATFSGAGGQ